MVTLTRVVVMTFLPNKYYDVEFSKKYKAQPMPAADSAHLQQTFLSKASVPHAKSLVPQKRNPDELEYKEALNHYPAVITSGLTRAKKLASAVGPCIILNYAKRPLPSNLAKA